MIFFGIILILFSGGLTYLEASFWLFSLADTKNHHFLVSRVIVH